MDCTNSEPSLPQVALDLVSLLLRIDKYDSQKPIRGGMIEINPLQRPHFAFAFLGVYEHLGNRLGSRTNTTHGDEQVIVQEVPSHFLHGTSKGSRKHHGLPAALDLATHSRIHHNITDLWLKT